MCPQAMTSTLQVITETTTHFPTERRTIDTTTPRRIIILMVATIDKITNQQIRSYQMIVTETYVFHYIRASLFSFMVNIY